MQNTPKSGHRALVKPSEAALMLGVTSATLASWVHAKHLECLTLPSGHRRYYLDTITELQGAA